MKIICISDTHNYHDQIELPEGDVIVHAGDCTGRGTEREIIEFLNWYSVLDFEHKILVAGNHDWGFETDSDRCKKLCADMDIIYLEDSGVTLDGIKFYGSPVQPEFCDWAFNKRRNKDSSIIDNGARCNGSHSWIKPHWDAIPESTDVLITHGPPKGILDVSIYNGFECGCNDLRNRVEEVKPKYHIFGHIHNWHGTKKLDEVTYVNASICTEQYNPTNEPIVVEI